MRIKVKTHYQESAGRLKNFLARLVDDIKRGSANSSKGKRVRRQR